MKCRFLFLITLLFVYARASAAIPVPWSTGRLYIENGKIGVRFLDGKSFALTNLEFVPASRQYLEANDFEGYVAIKSTERFSLRRAVGNSIGDIVGAKRIFPENRLFARKYTRRKGRGAMAPGTHDGMIFSLFEVDDRSYLFVLNQPHEALRGASEAGRPDRSFRIYALKRGGNDEYQIIKTPHAENEMWGPRAATFLASHAAVVPGKKRDGSAFAEIMLFDEVTRECLLGRYSQEDPEDGDWSRFEMELPIGFPAPSASLNGQNVKAKFDPLALLIVEKDEKRFLEYRAETTTLTFPLFHDEQWRDELIREEAAYLSGRENLLLLGTGAPLFQFSDQFRRDLVTKLGQGFLPGLHISAVTSPRALIDYSPEMAREFAAALARDGFPEASLDERNFAYVVPPSNSSDEFAFAVTGALRFMHPFTKRKALVVVDLSNKSPMAELRIAEQLDQLYKLANEDEASLHLFLVGDEDLINGAINRFNAVLVPISGTEVTTSDNNVDVENETSDETLLAVIATAMTKQFGEPFEAKDVAEIRTTIRSRSSSYGATLPGIDYFLDGIRRLQNFRARFSGPDRNRAIAEAYLALRGDLKAVPFPPEIIERARDFFRRLKLLNRGRLLNLDDQFNQIAELVLHRLIFHGHTEESEATQFLFLAGPPGNGKSSTAKEMVDGLADASALIDVRDIVTRIGTEPTPDAIEVELRVLRNTIRTLQLERGTIKILRFEELDKAPWLMQAFLSWTGDRSERQYEPDVDLSGLIVVATLNLDTNAESYPRLVGTPQTSPAFPAALAETVRETFEKRLPPTVLQPFLSRNASQFIFFPPMLVDPHTSRALVREALQRREQIVIPDSDAIALAASVLSSNQFGNYRLALKALRPKLQRALGIGVPTLFTDGIAPRTILKVGRRSDLPDQFRIEAVDPRSDEYHSLYLGEAHRRFWEELITVIKERPSSPELTRLATELSIFGSMPLAGPPRAGKRGPYSITSGISSELLLPRLLAAQPPSMANLAIEKYRRNLRQIQRWMVALMSDGKSPGPEFAADVAVWLNDAGHLFQTDPLNKEPGFSDGREFNAQAYALLRAHWLSQTAPARATAELEFIRDQIHQAETAVRGASAGPDGLARFFAATEFQRQFDDALNKLCVHYTDVDRDFYAHELRKWLIYLNPTDALHLTELEKKLTMEVEAGDANSPFWESPDFAGIKEGQIHFGAALDTMAREALGLFVPEYFELPQDRRRTLNCADFFAGYSDATKPE